MLRLWIVTSSLFVATYAVNDVSFSYGKECYSRNENMKLTAIYNGAGTVSAIQWYYSGQVANNLIVLVSNCDTAGAIDAGYPNTSRMAFTCSLATNTFTLTLNNLQDDELDGSWGATFSIAGVASPVVDQDSFPACQKCTCDCKCKKKCTRIVIPSIVFGCLGVINLPIVSGGAVSGFLGRTTALVVDSIGIVCDVISSVLGIVVQVEDCCEDAADCCEDDSDCCEDSNCCKDECERNWVENTGAAFIAIGVLVGILAGFIFHRVWSNRMGPGNNAYKAKEAKEPGENHGMTGTSM